MKRWPEKQGLGEVGVFWCAATLFVFFTFDLTGGGYVLRVFFLGEDAVTGGSGTIRVEI